MNAPNPQIEHLPTDSLVPYARNSRTHSAAQITAVAASITEFGFTNPVLIDADGGIIAGHGRVMAAKQLGRTSVPCLRLAHLTPDQRRAYVIADNKLAELAGWDDELLALEMRELQCADFDLALTGFSADELEELLFTEPEGKTDADAAPPVEAVAISKTGDVWILGGHRIMCGDSTDAAQVAQLMNGQKAVLMNTDPPYGVAYDNSERPNPGVAKPRVAKPRVANDDLVDGAGMQAFIERMLTAALPSMDDHAAYYFWHPMLMQGTFVAAAAAAAAGLLIHRQIVWVKPGLLLGHGDYHWKHELCFYGWRQGSRPPYYGPRNQTTIWEVGNVSQAERKEFNHATPKPVELFVRPIENHAKLGEICYEPFSGSGPQIIAAETTGRRCYAMEMHPQHVDVNVRRWQQFTGKTATHAATGAAFPG